MKRRVGIVDAMTSAKLFGPYFPGSSWNGWRTVLRGAFALPMTEREREFFRNVTGREPPSKRVRELWIIAGRRAGKDSIASLIVGHTAAMFSGTERLRRGERALCLALACDRDQAKIVLNYVRAYFAEIPALKAMVQRETANGFALSNGVDVAVGTNSFRSVRGRPILTVVLDECAFYRDENSASPDEEIYRALRPGMATLAGDAMLIGISTPYRRSGLLYKKFRDHYAKDGDVLVVKAPSTTLNPILDQSIIDAAMAEDPAAAAAEWLAEFRDDISGWLSRELIEAAVDRGLTVRPPQRATRYYSFCDPSGGANDSFTAAIAHNDNGTVVLDCLIEIKAPFNPDNATADIAVTLKSYNIHKTTADRYAAQWVVAAFARHGITLAHSERDRSQIYLDVLPLFSSGRVRLIDNQRLVSQFAALERRTFPTGKDRIDHSPGGHDDCANSAAGAMVLCAAPSAAETFARLNRNAPAAISSGIGMSAILYGDLHNRKYGNVF